jgi:hypothetical protein
MSSQVNTNVEAATLVVGSPKWKNPKLSQETSALRAQRLARQKDLVLQDKLMWVERQFMARKADELRWKIIQGKRRRERSRRSLIQPIKDMFTFGGSVVKYTLNTFLAARFTITALASIIRFGGKTTGDFSRQFSDDIKARPGGLTTPRSSKCRILTITDFHFPKQKHFRKTFSFFQGRWNTTTNPDSEFDDVLCILPQNFEDFKAPPGSGKIFSQFEFSSILILSEAPNLNSIYDFLSQLPPVPIVECASSMPVCVGTIENGVLFTGRFRNNRKFALPVVMSHRQDIYWHHWKNMERRNLQTSTVGAPKTQSAVQSHYCTKSDKWKQFVKWSRENKNQLKRGCPGCIDTAPEQIQTLWERFNRKHCKTCGTGISKWLNFFHEWYGEVRFNYEHRLYKIEYEHKPGTKEPYGHGIYGLTLARLESSCRTCFARDCLPVQRDFIGLYNFKDIAQSKEKKTRKPIKRTISLEKYTNVNSGLDTDVQCYMKTDKLFGFTRKTIEKKIEKSLQFKVKKQKSKVQVKPPPGPSHKDPKPQKQQKPRISTLRKEIQRLIAAATPRFGMEFQFSPEFQAHCPDYLKVGFMDLVNFESKYSQATDYTNKQFIFEVFKSKGTEWFKQLFPELKDWIFKKDFDPNKNSIYRELIYTYASDLAKIVRDKSYIY